MFTDSKNIHGDFFRSVMSYPEVARDFLRNRLSSDLVQYIDWNTLKLIKKSFVKEQFKHVHSDVVYQCQLDLNNKKSTIYLYLIFDSQDSPDILTPFYVLQYRMDLMEDHINQGNKYMPLVISICVYGGGSPCTYSEDVYECFKNSTLAREMSIFSFR